MKTNNLEQESFTGSRNFLWRNPESRFQITNVGKSLRKGKNPVSSCISIIIMFLNTVTYAHTLEHTKSELDLYDEGEVTRYNGVASYTLPDHLTFSEGKYSQDWHFFDKAVSDIAIGLNGSVEHIRSKLELILNNKGEVIRYNGVTTYALPKDLFVSRGKHLQNSRFFDVTFSDTEVSLQESVWVIGQNHDFAPGEPPIKTFGSSNSSWQPADRAAARIAVDSDGTPWVVSKSGKVYRLSGSTWEKIDANPITSDIATGKDGSVWRATLNSVDKWINDTALWQNYSVPGIATRIAIDNAGNPWIINSEKKIYRLNRSNWEKMPGRAIDIGSSGHRIWVTGDNKVIYFWDENDNDWEKAMQKNPSNIGWWTAITGKAVSVDHTRHLGIIDQNPHGVNFGALKATP
ncbi:MAG: hypothetical protein V3U88_04170 [Methylococcales bacterium]